MSAAVKEHLTTIYERHHSLTPRLVVDEARDPAHPLHDRFEWDDSIAGEMHRRTQAAALIRSVHITFAPRPESSASELKVRAFVALREEGEYVPTDEVSKSAHLTAMALALMEREWRQLRRKYQAHAEFWSLIERDVGGEQQAS